MKEENLGAHMERVHPAVSKRKYSEMNIRPPRRKRSTVAYVPYVALLLAVTMGAGLFFAAQPTEPAGWGRFSADHTYYDLGRVPQRVSEHSFSITNTGEGDLTFSGIWTSCGCTSAHLTIGGAESPHFGMHDNPSWEGRLAPGAQATLVVQYDALAHDDQYVGERSVFVKTNDPSAPEVEFRIRVNEG